MQSKYSSRLFRVEDGQVITVYVKTDSSAKVLGLKLANANFIDDYSQVHLNFSVTFNESGEIERNFDSANLVCDDVLTKSNVPFIRNDNLKIDIIVFKTLFFVLIDSKPYCMFPTQIPLNEVQKLIVDGDVISISGVNQTKMLPTPEPNENQLWQGLTPEAFKAGHLIVITAIPRNESGNLAINFRESPTTPILLQLSIMYDGENLDLKWRSESISTQECKIVPDEPVKIAILLGDTEFYVAVNTVELASFQYNEDAEKILKSLKALEILTARDLQFDIKAVDFMRISPDNYPSYATFHR